MAGGWSQIMPATEEVQRMIDQVTCQIFTANSYQEQVVKKGMNYCIKVEIGGNCPGSLYMYVYREPKLTDTIWIPLSEICEASTLPFPLDKIKQHAEDRTGKKYDIFKGINYKTLLTRNVGYTNYFIKVQVGEGEEDYLILRVACAVTLVSNPTLTNLLGNKTLSDDIEYFE
ncbi:uncharacterized protein LOC105009750 [Esox lucius]|uniref:Cystatin domain-containing protein n=1 Tax=Esox lucius TaxID=8010 RepID=A0A3P8ZRC3_ESOLU|nr:uncharacterized protein LOC105009750 [Esox lucius]